MIAVLTGMACGVLSASGDSPGVLAGKTVVLLGDSNTWIGGDDCSDPRGWNYWFARETDPGSIRSYARSGATWSHTSRTSRNTQEYSEVITDDNVVFNQAVRLLEAVDSGKQAEPDIVMIAAGTNDAWFPHLRPEEFSGTAREALGRDAVELLSLSPSRVLSLPEAVRYTLLILQGRFPQATLIVMTPLQSIRISDEMLRDVSGMIEEIALGSGAGVIRQDLLCPVRALSEMTRRRLTSDGTHTSPEGARRNAAVIAGCVEAVLGTSQKETAP